MLNNPFSIKPGTFFISGPLPSQGLENPHFNEVEKHISGKGYPVFNPEKNVYCKDTSKRIAFLNMCDFVVTLPGWEEQHISRNEVEIAKQLGKVLIFSEAFDHWDDNRKRLTNASA